MKGSELGIPHLFRCPISLDLFKDPVTLCTGQTYERSSIEKWLASGNLTCPVTMQKLHDLSIVPNHTLRHLIDQWLEMDHQFDHEYLQTIDPDLHFLAALKHNLESNESNLENKIQTLERVRVLYNEFPPRISCLIQLGFLPMLLKLVFDDEKVELEANLSQEKLNFVESSLSCVLKLLPFGEFECLNMLKQESNLSSFLVLFKQENTKINIGLCQLVEAISSSIETQELCAILGRNREFLHLIISVASSEEAGVKALSALCSLESNRENLVEEGAVDGLVTYILSSERSERRNNMAPIAMASLEVLLLSVESAKVALVNNPNGVNALVKMVFRVSDHQGSESAVNSVMIVCCDSLKAREDAICAGVLTQLLLLLQSQCNGRTKTKARMLLKLLRSMGD